MGFKLGVSAVTLVLVLSALAPAFGQAGSPRGEIIFIDDFIRDPALRSDDWQVNGPTAVSVLTNFPGARNAAMVDPAMRFNSQNGLGFAGSAAPGQQSGIQTRFAYTPPFRITAAGTAATVGAGTLEFAISTADGGAGAGVGVAGGAGPDAPGFTFATPQGAGKPWSAPPGQSWLTSTPPVAGKPYEVVVDVDGQGLGRLYVQADGKVLGAVQVQVGNGPFYVVVGQGSGVDAAGQPNLAYWKGVTVRRAP